MKSAACDTRGKRPNQTIFLQQEAGWCHLFCLFLGESPMRERWTMPGVPGAAPCACWAFWRSTSIPSPCHVFPECQGLSPNSSRAVLMRPGRQKPSGSTAAAPSQRLHRHGQPAPPPRVYSTSLVSSSPRQKLFKRRNRALPLTHIHTNNLCVYSLARLGLFYFISSFVCLRQGLGYPGFPGLELVIHLTPEL